MKYFANIYIGLWCLYNLQGTLYETGSIISRLVLVVLLVLSLYYFVLSQARCKMPTVLNILSWLIIIWSVYGVVNMLYGPQLIDSPRFTYLKNILSSLLPIYPLYYFFRKGSLTEFMLKLWIPIFVGISIAQFYKDYQESLMAAMLIGSSREEFVNNSGYIVLSVLPLIPLYQKKPLFQYIILAICAAFVIMSVKRGAMLTMAVASLYFFYKNFLSGRSRKTKFWSWMLTIVVLIAGFYFVTQYLSESDLFAQRLDDTRAGYSSGRDQIYSYYANYFFNQPFLYFLIGNGADGTIKLFGLHAHNDWLEIAIDNGLFVLILYFIYWVFILKTIKNYRGEDINKMMLSMFGIIFFLETFFSMSYNSIPIYSSIAFAYALATNSKVVYYTKKRITR